MTTSNPAQTPKQLLIDNIAARGAAVFEPIAGKTDVDLAVRTGDGQYVEVVIRQAAAPDKPRAFRMRRFRPRPNLFIVGVVDAPEGPEAWLLPSNVFERFAQGAPAGPEWLLNLDDSAGEPLSDRLAIYRERWALIADYSKFRSTLGDPVALQVRIAMG